MSIDLLRGIVMVLMVLDHVRDYYSAVRFDPLDLTQTSIPLFLTRWITHFCAPTFILLAGVSARLVSRRLTRPGLSMFLLTRGVWLVLLEVTVITYLWIFNFRYELGVILQVIWAIGISMIALAALVWLPTAVIAAISAAMIFGHNLLDGLAPASFGRWSTLWALLHVQAQTPHAYVAYPVVPWIGVMAGGYLLGAVYSWDEARRRRTLLMLGLGAIALFVILRAPNAYGDALHWAPQPSAARTVLSFINTTKYPPSLLYLLMTLGPSLVLLSLFESADRGRLLTRVFVTFGSVPFFFYVSHLMLAHLSAGSIALATGYGLTILGNVFVLFAPGWGFGLPVVYLAWLAIVVALYPACRWFAALKRSRSDWWLSYV